MVSTTSRGADVAGKVTGEGRVQVQPLENARIARIQVWNSAGQEVWNKPWNTNEPVQLPKASGVYFIAIESNKGRMVQKVVRS